MNSSYNPMAAGGGMLGAGLASMFSDWQNPANAAQGPMNQIQQMLPGMYQPYQQAGQGALNQAQGIYGNLASNPGQAINQIGQNYHQSPGFQFALQQALMGANQGAAAGGMAGSLQNQQQNMGLATNMANQDYYNYLQNAMGGMNTGLQGLGGIANMGYNASNSLAGNLGNSLMAQGLLNYQGANAQNQQNAGGMGALFGGLGTLAGSMIPGGNFLSNIFGSGSGNSNGAGGPG